MDINKIREWQTIAADGAIQGAPKPTWAEIRDLLGDAEEAHRLRLVLQEVGLRNTRQNDRVREAWLTLQEVLKSAPMDPAGAYVPQEVRDYIVEGKLIQAIKHLRDVNPGLGLGDAKRIVDGLR